MHRIKDLHWPSFSETEYHRPSSKSNKYRNRLDRRQFSYPFFPHSQFRGHPPGLIPQPVSPGRSSAETYSGGYPTNFAGFSFHFRWIDTNYALDRKNTQSYPLIAPKNVFSGSKVYGWVIHNFCIFPRIIWYPRSNAHPHGTQRPQRIPLWAPTNGFWAICPAQTSHTILHFIDHRRAAP